jgi:hypothetical protein
MAYLTFAGSEENQSTCFKFIGANSSPKATTHLISNNTSLISSTLSQGGNDSCSFYSGPSDAAIIAFGESYETNGSIAFVSGESCGSIAYSGGGESCGSVASASVSTGSSGSFSSYSC